MYNFNEKKKNRTKRNAPKNNAETKSMQQY